MRPPCSRCGGPGGSGSGRFCDACFWELEGKGLPTLTPFDEWDEADRLAAGEGNP